VYACFEGDGRWWWQESAATLENECRWLIFGGGRSGDVAKEPPPSRMSIRGSFSRVGGGDVAKEPPPSKTSIRGSFSRVVVVVMLPKSNHPQKRALYARIRGWRWWWRWWAMEKHPSNLWVVKSMLVST